MIPIYETMGEPVAGSYNRVKLPEYVSEYVQDRSKDEKEYALSAAYEPEEKGKEA